MASSDVELITFWATPFGLRVEFALTAKGVPYERLLEVDHIRQKSKRLVESNPIYKMVPVLIHKGKPLCESLIIIEYIDEVWPSANGKDILPKDPYKRSVARFWADFVAGKLYTSLSQIIIGSKEVQEKAIVETREHLATLEGAFATVSEGGPYWGGENLGFADMVMGPLVAWFPTYEALGGFQFQFEENFPRLHAWIEAIKASPCGSILQDSAKITELMLHVRSSYYLQPKV